MSKLVLINAGFTMKEAEINIPSYKSITDIFQRADAKVKFVERKIREFKLENITLLSKIADDYEIHLII
mgnify:CR=1 FL=1